MGNNSKMGRPTTDPKNTTIKIRLSDKDIQALEFCSEKKGLSKSDIVRLGIRKIYDELEK